MPRYLAVFALIAVFGLAVPTLGADKDKDKGKGKGNPHASKNDDDRWERRDGYEYRTYDRGARPAGWSKGRKTGWGDCGLPPGQAKKSGDCRMYVYQGHPHYYYKDDQGRYVIRRQAWGRDRDQDRDHDRH